MKTLRDQAVAKLAKDFRRWGRKRTLLVQKGVNRWGVQFSRFFIGKKGSPISYALGWTPGDVRVADDLDSQCTLENVWYIHARRAGDARGVPEYDYRRIDVLMACRSALRK